MIYEKEQYTWEDFRGIIARLRAPEGCPWDRAQTHQSLRGCMIEEAYEAVDAIRILSETGNSENLQEELGDADAGSASQSDRGGRGPL